MTITLVLRGNTGLYPSDSLTNNNIILGTGLESGAIWHYAIDSGTWTVGGTVGAAGTFSLSGVLNGQHNYRIKQVDTAGNFISESNIWKDAMPGSITQGDGVFTINGENAGDFSGYSVTKAGDVNGDGLADLIVGANMSGTGYAGKSYVVFGKTTNTTVELSNIANGAGGFVINGEAGSDRSGYSVAGAGDINGDGLADLIVGAKNADPFGGKDAGKSYIVFGKTNTTAIKLNTLGTAGFVINGENAYDQSGWSVSSAGDVNGDGLADLIVGADSANPSGTGRIFAGKSYVVFGKTSTTAIELSNIANGTGGFAINGEKQSDRSGRSVSSAGDVNGDGLADLIVGADSANPSGTGRIFAGKSYVVFGKTSTTAIELSNIANGTGGFAINGESTNDQSGVSVSSAGDVNGDGLSDLIIGANLADPTGKTDAGKSYVVFGKTETASVELSQIANGTGGFAINGESTNDQSGVSVSSAGDVNGDGLSDLIIGARFADPARKENAGRSYIIFGSISGEFYQTRVDWMGTSADDSYASISTVTTAQTLVGGDGNDTLTAGLGADVLYGGRGDDIFIINSNYLAKLEAGFDANAGKLAIIDGGLGIDTLRLAINSGITNLDLTVIKNIAGGNPNINSRIASIEKIDLSIDTTENTLTLSYKDIQDMAGMNWINSSTTGADGKIKTGNLASWTSGTYTLQAKEVFHQLVVNGGSNDQFDIDFSTTFLGTVSNGNIIYNVYQDITHKVELFVQSGVNVLGTQSPTTSIAWMNGANDVGADNYINQAEINTNLIMGGTVINSNASIHKIILNAEVGTDITLTNNLPTLNANGTWTLANSNFANALQDNTRYTVEVYVTDRTGRDAVSISTAVMVDKTPPTMPTLTLKADTGVSTSDNITNDDSISIAGLESGSVWFYQIDSTTGTWVTGTGIEFNPSVADGLHTYYVRQVDRAGNSSVIGSTMATLDTNVIATIVNSEINLENTLQIVFGENINVNNGNIVIMKKGTTNTTFAILASQDTTQVNWSSDQKTLTLKPNQNWQLGEYYLQINSNMISDLAGNSYTQTQIYATPAMLLRKIAGGTGGFAINGENEVDQSSKSVSSAGDINGDGLADLIVGANSADPAGKTSAGRSYVIFGRTETTSIELSALGTGGFVINGENANDSSGTSVSSAGDVNGDGLADLIVGAYLADPSGRANAGKSYVVFGKSSTTSVNLSQIVRGTGGFAINGEKADDYSGASVSSVGDVNGDGLADLIVGAYLADLSSGTQNAGKSYVVFGKTNTSAIELSKIVNGTGGFAINGEIWADKSGISVEGSGDVNGDGLADLIVGAYWANSAGSAGKANVGKSYVVFGKTSSTSVELTNITNGTGGFAIYGENANDQSGISLSSAGDVNGDGLSDLIVGAYLADPTGRTDAGKSYVVFGKTSTSRINLNQITNGTGGFAINGENATDNSGYSVAGAGDINGDGLNDLIVGAYLADPAGRINAGKSYVVFGKTNTSAIELSQIINGTGGFAIHGENGDDQSGISVSSAGDVNGDGLADLIVGAIWADPTGKADAGKSYVIFGSASSEFYQTKVDWVGTSTDKDKVSTSISTTAQTLVGGDSNNILTAGLGADVLYGGRGDDVFVINNNYLAKLVTGFDATAEQLAMIDGGLGIDTLRLGANSGVTNLDLTAIKNIASNNPEINSRIASIEKIDLSADATANTLKLSYLDIQDMAGMNWINSSTTGADGQTKTGNLAGWAGGTYSLKAKEEFHQLVVNGGTGGTSGAIDRVDIDFAFTGVNAPASSGTVTQTIGSATTTYNVYQDTIHKVEIFVQSGMAVI